MSTSPNFYVIGTKYARLEDVLPAMILHGVISTGFAEAVDLTPILGKSHSDALAWLEKKAPDESGSAKGTLARFAGIKPGDVVALKAHSAPNGNQARLVIARYAVVTGSACCIYARSPVLGHTLGVEFLDEQEPLELNLGYGQTLHLIYDPNIISLIFGPYAEAASSAASHAAGTDNKATHTSEVLTRGAYLMQRVHNQIQNKLRHQLIRLYGEACVAQEERYVDLIVRLPSKTILIEVKSSPSPISCVREAIGQLLQYSWRLGLNGKSISYIVVGPSEPKTEDQSFFSHIASETKISLRYCTPATFSSVNA